MNYRMANRLYDAAARAVKDQFPHLPEWQFIEMIIDELIHRHGAEMAEEIIFKAI